MRAVGSAPLDMARDSAQLFHAGNEILERKGNEFKTGENQPLINVDVDPALLQVMRENSGNPLSKSASAIIGGAGKLAGNASDAIQSGYSEDAKLAASMKPFDYDKEKGVTVNPGLFDKDVWFMNALPAITQMLTGGLVAKVGAKTAENVVEQAVYNKLSKTIPEEVARATAKETAQLASARAHKTGFVGAMTLPAQGGGGTNMREEINALPFNSLIESPSFQKAFDEVDLNPINASLSDTEKLTLARNQVADKAASALTADPRMLMVNIAASVLGDHTLAKLVTKQIAVKGPLQGAILGATSEAATEQLQGSSQRYVQNEQLINTAGQKIDQMKDVISTGMNNAIFGMGIGGGAGLFGGMRGSRTAPEQQGSEQQNQPVNDENIAPEQQPVNGNNPDVTPEQPASAAPGQFADEEVAGAAPTRTDEFRDTPAYLRQDPRIQGFAEDNDVQRALTQQSLLSSVRTSTG